MSHDDILDIDRGHIFRKHRHKNNKKVAVIYEKTVKNWPLLRFLQAGCYVHLLRNFKRALCVREYSWRRRLCVQTAWRVPLGRWPCMIDLGKTSVGETDVDWERIERGWRYPGAHDLYKETYIRHLKNRGLSVTKSTKKGMDVFSWQKWRSFRWGPLVIWDVLTQKRGVFAWQMIKITELSVKNEVFGWNPPNE